MWLHSKIVTLDTLLDAQYNDEESDSVVPVSSKPGEFLGEI